MALSNLEKALIERLQEPRLDSGLNAAANIVHEITRIQAPDNETPADYIRRAVQELKSDPTLGLELAVEAYKHYSGFQFNAQSGKPTDYLIEMAKRHKQLFESDRAVDTHPGIREAAMLISNRAGMPLLPGESYGDFLARVADKLHGNYAQGVADIVNKLMDASGISFIGSESSGEYIKRVGEIAKRVPDLIFMIADRAGVHKRTDGQTDVDFIKLCLDEIDNNGYAAALEHICEHTDIRYSDNAQVIVTNIIDTINKNKKPE